MFLLSRSVKEVWWLTVQRKVHCGPKLGQVNIVSTDRLRTICELTTSFAFPSTPRYRHNFFFFSQKIRKLHLLICWPLKKRETTQQGMNWPKLHNSPLWKSDHCYFVPTEGSLRKQQGVPVTRALLLELCLLILSPEIFRTAKLHII